MAKKLENIFNECVERMLQGEGLESCLGSYPEEAVELEPMLRTAFDVRRRALPVQPHPEFENRTRVRLEGAQLYAKHQKQAKRTGVFAWQRGWAYALTAILVILFASASTAAASSNAMPDEPLYPVKLATEQVRLAFTFSDAGKAKLHTQFAENRVQEIAAMARQGKTEQVATAIEKLDSNLEKANCAIVKVEKVEAKQFITLPKDRESKQLKELVKGGTSENIAILENALENTPEQTKPALQQAIEILKKSYEGEQQETGAESEGKPIPVKPEQPHLVPQK